METLRGGILILFRWFIHYPFVFGTYWVRNWTAAPYRINPSLLEPQGKRPGILVSNYGNYFYDDCLGLMLAPVWPFFFVKDSIYRLPLLKPLFRFFRGMPVIRTSDTKYGPEERAERNEKTFSEVAGLLRKGHWLTAFPEASAYHRSQITTPLKPGVAHVALRAEDAAGWGLGLMIYVYGTNYENKFIGRSNVYVRWATPLHVADYREQYMRDPLAAETALMQEVESALHTCLVEAPTLEQLADAHRLAFQRHQANLPSVQNALTEVVSGRSSPEQMHRIVCRRGSESVVYQVLGYALLGVGFVIGWPFRMFGRLCATDRSEEMSFQTILWVLVLLTGAFVSDSRWATTQILITWAVMTVWLWAWRRGIIERA